MRPNTETDIFQVKSISLVEPIFDVATIYYVEIGCANFDSCIGDREKIILQLKLELANFNNHSFTAQVKMLAPILTTA